MGIVKAWGNFKSSVIKRFWLVDEAAIAPISDQLHGYERNERRDYSEDFADTLQYAVDELVEHPGLRIIKPIRHNPKLQHRKNKSQRNNWSKWKRYN